MGAAKPSAAAVWAAVAAPGSAGRAPTSAVAAAVSHAAADAEGAEAQVLACPAQGAYRAHRVRRARRRGCRRSCEHKQPPWVRAGGGAEHAERQRDPGSGGDPDRADSGGDPDRADSGGDPDRADSGGDPDRADRGGDADSGGDADRFGSGIRWVGCLCQRGVLRGRHRGRGDNLGVPERARVCVDRRQRVLCGRQRRLRLHGILVQRDDHECPRRPSAGVRGHRPGRLSDRRVGVIDSHERPMRNARLVPAHSVEPGLPLVKRHRLRATRQNHAAECIFTC
jgi:hypothetical protein